MSITDIQSNDGCLIIINNRALCACVILYRRVYIRHVFVFVRVIYFCNF